MSEGVEILLSADDQASQKMAALTKNIENNVKNIKDTGSKAKASTEFFGQIANVTGNSQLGGYASQLAGLTEKIGQFSEVSKAGGVGALAFQAGLVGAAGVISFGIGKAIGDVVFETKRWTDELEAAKKKMGEIDQQMLTIHQKQLKQRREIFEASGGGDNEAMIKAEISALEKKLSTEQQSLERANEQLATAKQIKKESWTETPVEMNGRLDTATKAVALAEEKLKATRAEVSAYEDMVSVHAKELEAIKQTQAIKLQWQQAVAEDRQRNVNERIKEAELAQKEYEDELKNIEALKKADEERNRKAIENQLNLNQKLAEDNARRFEDEQAAAASLAMRMGAATTNTATESRLLTRGPSQDQSTIIAANTQRQAEASEKMLAKLEEQNRLLNKKNNAVRLEVVA
jgi:hypothetical protein